MDAIKYKQDSNVHIVVMARMITVILKGTWEDVMEKIRLELTQIYRLVSEKVQMNGFTIGKFIYLLCLIKTEAL